MKSVIVWALVAVNIVLGLSLLAKFGRESTAIAQVGRPSDYLMVPGQVVGGSNAVIYIIDMSNGQLTAMSYDPTRNRFDIMPPIDLSRMFDTVLQNQNRGNAPRR
jgi:hypothetical protein